MKTVVAVGIMVAMAVGMGAADEVCYLAPPVTTLAAPISLASQPVATLSSGHRRDPNDIWKSLVYTGAITEALKLATHQPRPNDRNATDGFPSMHTSLAFALARSLSAQDSHWTIPAYAAAAGVGWWRVHEREHYPLQVIGGAALGYFVADEVCLGKW